MDEYVKRTGIHPSQYKRNKKRTIIKVLSGSSTHIETINEWNITWNDLLNISNDTSNVKLQIKNYLNPENQMYYDTITKLQEKVAALEKVSKIDIEKVSKIDIETDIERVNEPITVYFNKYINLYNKKEALYGHEKASLYISNIFHNLSKYNKLDWINDPDIMGDHNPITHIGKHQYEVYTSVGIMKKMTLEEIEIIGIDIMDMSMRRCLAIEISNARHNFIPNVDDHFYNLYSNNMMLTNPYYKIENLKLPKYKISTKCKIGTQKTFSKDSKKILNKIKLNN
jgi:hypothetical protein